MPQRSTCNIYRIKCSKCCSESSCGFLMSPLNVSVKLRKELSILVGYACLDCVKNFVCRRHLVLCYRNSLIYSELGHCTKSIPFPYNYFWRAWEAQVINQYALCVQTDLTMSVRGVMQRHFLCLSQWQNFQPSTPVYNLSWWTSLIPCPWGLWSLQQEKETFNTDISLSVLLFNQLFGKKRGVLIKQTWASISVGH